MEKKYLNVKFELKGINEDDTDHFIFEGYASTFDNVDRGDDIVVRGAFVDSLKEMMPKLLWQHDHAEPIGIFTEAFEDEKGLFVRGKMPKSDALVRDRVIPQIKVGSINSMSIGFSIWMDGGTVEIIDDGNTEIRKIKKVKLWEVSLVTIPMNPLATINNFKSHNSNITDLTNHFDAFEHIKSVSEYLKELGHSNSQSNSFIGAIKRITRNEEVTRNEEAELKKLHESIKNLNKSIKEKQNV